MYWSILYSSLWLRILVMTFPVCDKKLIYPVIAAFLRLWFLLEGDHCYIQKVSGPFAGDVYSVQEFSHLFHTVAS
uniref:Putative secreted protein n=1 Tax=Xenopsylla cheopis TaxID=163159 RepID=A0A6M2DY86_XENCH